MAGNQYQSDPRQELYLANYLDPESDTFSNSLQSALKAGYSQEYAESLKAQMPDWLSEKLGDAALVKAAEKALGEAVNYLTVDEEGKVDAAVARVKLEAAKTILKGIQKNKWSEKSITEHSGKIQTESLDELTDEQLDELIARAATSAESKEN